MRKANVTILASILIMALVAAGVGAGTMAYFSDVETSTGNTFTAGTIDISVGGQNPWSQTFSDSLKDVKPCEVREITFVIANVGENPVKVWKLLTVTGCSGGTNTYPVALPVASSEPEWEEGGGAGYVEKCDIDTVIIYDLYVGTTPIISESSMVMVSAIKGNYIYLGEILKAGSITVKQSYHMKGDTTNWAQGDIMTFDIKILAQQITAPAPSPLWP